jgi:hypothetical protein
MNLSLEHLPDSAKDLLEVISLQAVFALVRQLGGTRLRIHAKPNDELVALIGIDDAIRLSRIYKHLVISIPKCKKALMMTRDQGILQEKREGKGLAELAIKYQLTEVGISLALRRAEKFEYQQHTEKTRQLDIFR